MKFKVDTRLVYQVNASYGWQGTKFQLVCVTKGAVVLQRRSDARRFVLQVVTFADLLAKGQIKPLRIGA